MANSNLLQSRTNPSPLSQPVAPNEDNGDDKEDEKDEIIEIIDLADDSESTHSINTVDDQSSDESENDMFSYFSSFDAFRNSYCCPICLEKPRSPISTMCGHIFCEVCIRRLFCVRVAEEAVITRMITTSGDVPCARVACCRERFIKSIFELFVGKG